MGVGTGLYVYDVVVKKFTFAISSPDEFLLHLWCTLNSSLVVTSIQQQSSSSYMSPVSDNLLAKVQTNPSIQAEAWTLLGHHVSSPLDQWPQRLLPVILVRCTWLCSQLVQILVTYLPLSMSKDKKIMFPIYPFPWYSPSSVVKYFKYK